MPKKTAFLLIILALAAPAAEPTIAIVDFEAVNCDAGLARGASELVRAELYSRGDLRLVERGRLAQVLQEQALALSGLTEGDAAQVGRLVEADYILLGSVTEFDGAFTIAVRFVNVATGLVAKGAQETAQVERRIPAVCSELAEELAEAAGALPLPAAAEGDTPYNVGLALSGTLVFHLMGDIHSLDLATGEGRQLTADGQSWQSTISRDGELICFSSKRTGNLDLYLMRPDGSGVEQLTATPSVEDSAAWSPDDDALVFHTDRDGNYEIYTLDVSSGDTARVTNHPAEDSYPDWSPDGEWIAFQSRRTAYTGQPEVYLCRPDGSDIRRLGPGLFPRFSPDGDSVVCVRSYTGASNWQEGDWELAVYDAESGDSRRLTENGGAKRFPAFTADGRTVIFDDAYTDIFAYSLDTGDIYRVTWNGCCVPSYGESED